MPAGAPFDPAVYALAHSSVDDRRWVIVSSSKDGGVSWSIYFNVSGPRPFAEIHAADRGVARTLQQITEETAIAYTRRQARRRDPIVNPLDMETAEQRLHDREVASAAARVGGLWGGGLGLLASLIVAIFAAAAGQPNPGP